MSYNLGNLPKEEMDKVNVDLAASGVAYKERMNMPIVPAQVEAEQPEHLRELFRVAPAVLPEPEPQIPRAKRPAIPADG